MGDIVIARYEAWIRSLPTGEADIPYIARINPVTKKEVLLTPNQALSEMRSKTPLGEELQEAENLLYRYEMQKKDRIMRG